MEKRIATKIISVCFFILACIFAYNVYQRNVWEDAQHKIKMQEHEVKKEERAAEAEKSNYGK